MQISKRKLTTLGITAVILTLTLSGAGATYAQTPFNATGTLDTINATGTNATGTATGTPGIPNTGAGGNAAANIAVLTVAALAALGGAYVLRRKRS